MRGAGLEGVITSNGGDSRQHSQDLSVGSLLEEDGRREVGHGH